MALICSDCCSHNGMAMAEEFDYVTYVCAYCGRLNAARKQRPAAPLLAPARPLPIMPRGSLPGSSEESIPSSGSDTDDEARNAVTKSCESEEKLCPPCVDEETKTDQEKKED